MLRMKSHSTSDDQSRYQDMEEVKHWEENNCPVKRVEGYLSGRGLWKQVHKSKVVRLSVNLNIIPNPF